MTAVGNQLVRRQNGWASGVGHDGQPGSLGSWLLGQNLCHIEDIGDIADTQDAAAPESGVEHLITARK